MNYNIVAAFVHYQLAVWVTAQENPMLSTGVAASFY